MLHWLINKSGRLGVAKFIAVLLQRYFMTPLVSIITPSHNVEGYIVQTTRSVIDQSFQNWELVIVDDASSDNIVELVDYFVVSDHRIRMFSNSKNIGPGPSRNRGWRKPKVAT